MINQDEVIVRGLSSFVEDKEKQLVVEDILAQKYGIPRGTFSEIVANFERFEHLTKDEKIIVLDAMYQVLQDEELNPENFYTEKEIEKSKRYKYVKKELSLPITYKNTICGSEYDYITKLSYQEIAEHWNSRVWSYNYNTQRNPTKRVKKDGTIILKPKLNKRSVQEIKTLMLEGRYKPDVIVINVLMDGTDELFYNDDTMELTIESATEINLIDGFHRVQAILEALEEKPDLRGYLYVSIRNYDLETARFYLGQHNSFNTFDKTHVRQLKSLGMADKVVEDLNVKSDLKGRITTSTSVKHKFNEITNFAVLSDAIRNTFNPQTGKDRLDTTYVLTRFFDYLLGSFEDAFVKNVQEVAEKSWINHHNTFVGYVVIAKRLYDKYGKDFPLDEIVRIVNSIDFSKNGSEFDQIMSSQGKVNSNRVKTQIRKFFEKKMDELLP